MQHRNASKAGATYAIAGAALLFVGTYLHPMEANPNEPVAAFTDYATDDFWVVSHLMQLAGVASEVFHAAFAVHQIEVGLASMSSLSIGLTTTLYGVALMGARIYPKWFAALAMASGVPTIALGVVVAYSGFSGLSTAINMPASAILLVWMLTLRVLMWRQDGVPLDDETSV